MAWPATAVVTDDPVTASQLNGLPVRIANTTLSGDAASIDFTSIPAHYAHLMLVCYLRSSAGSTVDNGLARFNNDSAGNYDVQLLQATAATPSASESFAATSWFAGGMPGNTAGANLFSAVTVTVQHSAGGLNNKVTRSRWAIKFGTTTADISIGAAGGSWRSNVAINQVTVFAQSGDLKSGSRATLYGLPG